MDRLFALIGDLGDGRGRGAETFCDRLSCTYTTFILSIFALMVTTNQYVGEPISCRAPDHFTKSQVDYTNKICWVTNTYKLPFDKEIPREGEPVYRIGYYQWIALILIGQSLLFYLPRVVWRVLNKKSGISISTITDAALDLQAKMESESRQKILKYMTKHMGRFLRELNKRYMMTSKFRGFWWTIWGNYLVLAYLLIKLLYLTNVIGQLFLLNVFLDIEFNKFGLLVLDRVAKGENWANATHFPRVTMCDFHIREVGNVQRYTVQCALPINLFNEIIFIFIWFWFVFVAFSTCGSLLMLLFDLIYTPQQMTYIKSRLLAMDQLTSDCSETLRKFVFEYLRRDGVFMVKLVGKEASDVIAAELTCGLWEDFRQKPQVQPCGTSQTAMKRSDTALTPLDPEEPTEQGARDN